MKRHARSKVTPEIVEKMRKLRKQGLAYARIGDKLDLSPMTIYNHLKKNEEPATEKPVPFAATVANNH